MPSRWPSWPSWPRWAAPSTRIGASTATPSGCSSRRLSRPSSPGSRGMDPSTVTGRRRGRIWRATRRSAPSGSATATSGERGPSRSAARTVRVPPRSPPRARDGVGSSTTRGSSGCSTNSSRRAAEALPLIHDLAIGASADGADAWRWQDTFADGVRVGAPPDEFNTLGQDWGLPPFDPWRLRAAGYEPFIRVVRAGLRHAGGLRFDHVMGLFRLFWIPLGGAAGEGTYVRYPWWDLLDILALESARAGAFVVGEDLGTVEDSTRHELHRRGVLSYRLLWFEPTAPDSGRWPHQALAAVTTHDLPTVAGLWSGSDVEAQRGLGLHPNEEATAAIAGKLSQWTGLDRGADVESVIDRTYGLLGRAPAAVVTATLGGCAGRRGAPQPARHDRRAPQLESGSAPAVGGDRSGAARSGHRCRPAAPAPRAAGRRLSAPRHPGRP